MKPVRKINETEENNTAAKLERNIFLKIRLSRSVDSNIATSLSFIVIFKFYNEPHQKCNVLYYLDLARPKMTSTRK